MGDVYLYLDETGDFDMSGKAGASQYFGLGQATFHGHHGRQVWEGTQLRFALESKGIRLPSGLHAKNDHPKTRERVFDLIRRHKPRIDVTLLLKEKANPTVRRRIAEDEMYLYGLAWYLHFKFQAQNVLKHVGKNDTVYVVAATLGTGKKKQAARDAVERVCAQFPKLNVTLCTWDSSSAWGLQVADYVLWSVQRRILKGYCDHYETVFPLLRTCFRPWEWIRQRPAISEKPEKRAPGSLVTDHPAATVPVAAPSVKAGDHEDAGLTVPSGWWNNQADPWDATSDEEEVPWADELLYYGSDDDPWGYADPPTHPEADRWSAAPQEIFKDLSADEYHDNRSLRRLLDEGYLS